MTDDYLTIASEIRELENLLAAIPEGNVIERMSLESRLESAKAALTGLPQQVAPKARLTFRAKPVFGSHGIAADFGGKAAGAFSDAFAAVAAAIEQATRKERERCLAIVLDEARRLPNTGPEWDREDSPEWRLLDLVRRRIDEEAD